MFLIASVNNCNWAIWNKLIVINNCVAAFNVCAHAYHLLVPFLIIANWKNFRNLKLVKFRNRNVSYGIQDSSCLIQTLRALATTNNRLTKQIAGEILEACKQPKNSA